MGLLKQTEGMTTMNERPTPETDAAWAAWPYAGPGVHANFARKLERERDEARVELRKLRIENNHNWQAIEFAEEAVKKRDEALKQCGQLKAMRDAIKEAHGAISQCLKYILKLPLSGSDAECEVMDDAHHALRKLKPFIND